MSGAAPEGWYDRLRQTSLSGFMLPKCRHLRSLASKDWSPFRTNLSLGVDLGNTGGSKGASEAKLGLVADGVCPAHGDL